MVAMIQVTEVAMGDTNLHMNSLLLYILILCLFGERRNCLMFLFNLYQIVHVLSE